MTTRLLPWPNRILLHLRAHSGPLAVVGLVALAFLGLDFGFGRGSGGSTQLVIALGVPMALSSGGFGIRGGAATLWVQKPLEPLRYYLATVTQNVAVSVGMVIVLLVTLSALASRLGWEMPPNPLWVLCALSLRSLLVASMTCGASPWLPRIGWLVTLAMFAFTFFIIVSVSSNPALLDRPWVEWILAILPPWGSTNVIWNPDGFEASEGVRALGRILLYCGVWVALGAVGFRRLLINGTLLREHS